MRLCFGLLSLLVILLADCARFRIEELKPSVIASFPIVSGDESNPEQMVQSLQKNRVIYNFPTKPVTDGQFAYVVDPNQHLVRVLPLTGRRPSKLIGAKVDPLPEGVEWIKIPAGVPGQVAVDEEGNLYIQNHISKPTKGTDNKKENALPLPSQILHIREGAELAWSIGRGGLASEPFEQILRMDAASGGRLFVLHTVEGEKILNLYLDGKEAARYEPSSLTTEEERKEYFIDVEDIVPDLSGEYAFASVAFRKKSDYDLVYRKIYRLDGSPEELLVTEDANEYFAWSRPEEGFYTLRSDEDGSRLLLKVYSSTGEYLSNLLLVYPDIRESWRETYMTMQNRIYTSRLSHGHLELYEWK